VKKNKKSWVEWVELRKWVVFTPTWVICLLNQKEAFEHHREVIGLTPPIVRQVVKLVCDWSPQNCSRVKQCPG